MSTGDWHRDYETRQVTAYLSAYVVSRQYGGPEEGGWWYDDFEWLRVSIPFRALQDFRFVEVDDEFSEVPGHDWRPYAPPRPADVPAQVWLDSARMQLESLFGEETRTRSSVLSDGDIEFRIERSPGELADRPRPRFE